MMNRNPVVHAAYMRDWRAKNNERAREISREGNAKYRSLRYNQYLESANKYNEKCRQEIFAFFGASCVSCGFQDRRALELDHINGREPGEKRLVLSQKLRLVRSDPDLARTKFQVLCANCNMIKRAEKQEYKVGRRKPA